MKKYILHLVLYVNYLISFAFKIKDNRITYISYKSDKLEGNFKLISKEIDKLLCYEQKYILLKYKKSLAGDLQYFFNCIKQLYYINTSKLVILDYNNFVVSNYKKDKVKVLQVWHASGAIKKFGNDIKREYKIKGYDYVLANSKEWVKPFSTAFGVEEENVIITGIPKTDRIFSGRKQDKYRSQLLEKYPQLKDKKVVLYAPTFRGDAVKDTTFININLDYLEKKLGEEYIVIYKMHPILEEKTMSKSKTIINANKEDIYSLFTVTDILISDYSAIILDFLNFNKPIISYVPDIDKYKSERGLYINYEKDIPSIICKTENDIIEAIAKSKFINQNMDNYKNKYFKYSDGKSTKRVVDLIERIMNM